MIGYHNLSTEELLRQAEYEDNTLALTLYEGSYDEGYADAESEFCSDDIDSKSVSETIRHIYTEAKWNKEESGEYVLGAFDTNTNVNHHDVRLKKVDQGEWLIEIGCGPYGEEEINASVVGGVKDAKNRAIDIVVELAVEGKLAI